MEERTKDEESVRESSAEATTAPAEESVCTDNDTGTISEQAPDYGKTERDDLAQLRVLFPEMEGAADLSVLTDPRRYGELRELGLSPQEAYRAVGRTALCSADNRAHLRSAVPRITQAQDMEMTEGELRCARDLFGDMSDAQIRKLYAKVTR